MNLKLQTIDVVLGIVLSQVNDFVLVFHRKMFGLGSLAFVIMISYNFYEACRHGVLDKQDPNNCNSDIMILISIIFHLCYAEN